MVWTRRIVARALADRKGVTAVEYAVIATGLTTIVLAAYNAFFPRVAALLNVITIP